MRRYQAYNLLLWGLAGLVLTAHILYLSHWFQWTGVWRVIHLTGHALGWLGGAAMALSLLYIPRKRKLFTWGRVALWYRVHVVLGLIGPSAVLLHTYGKYYGLAGLGLGLCWLVMFTGIIGHFIYRRLPEEVFIRAGWRADHLARLEELTNDLDLEKERLTGLRREMDDSGVLAGLDAAARPRLPRPVLRTHPGRAWRFWLAYRADERRLARLKPRIAGLPGADGLWRIVRLERQARRLLWFHELYSLWRRVHVPLSRLMWIVTGFHLFAWLYY